MYAIKGHNVKCAMCMHAVQCTVSLFKGTVRPDWI